MKHLILSILSICFSVFLMGQTPYHITIIRDDEGSTSQAFEDEIKSEIQALLASQYSVTFSSLNVNNRLEELTSLAKEIYQDTISDLVIAMGFNAGGQLVKLDSFSKPTILTLILDNELQGIPITPGGTSGVKNLTYIQSPFNINRDLQTLFEIILFKNVAVIGGKSLEESDFDYTSYFRKRLEPTNAEYTQLFVEDNAETLLASIPEAVDAVYVLPILDDLPPLELKKLMDGLSEKGLPAFSLFSSPMLDLGAYAAYETDINLHRIPRRVALNVLKIVEGQAAADLPVNMESFTENLVINMETARKTGHYPNWDVLAKGILINVNKIPTDRSLNLKSAIAEGLQNNLELKIAQKETAISGKDVGIARSNYLPQVEASSTALTLDETSIERSFGTRASLNWTASATLSQLILSEPAMANITIQKLLLQSQEQSQKQSELDVVRDVADAFLGILQATEIVKLRNENLRVTRQNYNIAQAKVQVGYAGTNDAYRWESELALDNVDLNNAQAQLQQARYNLNSLLNRPINEPFNLEDVTLTGDILLVMDNRLFPWINNPGDIETFSNFLVKEAFVNLPEIKQIQLAIAAQERSLRSQKRAFYLPQVALSSQYDIPIGNYNYPETVMPVDQVHTYNAALNLQIPIFQGYNRRYQKEQTELGILQLEDQMADLRNKLELQVRANLQIAGASFSNLNLSRTAAEAARKNFEIAQDSYQQGLLNITSLIDAQNASLQAEINATNAVYTFVSDFLAVERSIGYFHFLALPEDQDAFFQRFIEFITKK